ncbi:UNVERIFIED_CONTAM: hypothetical protein FKN15_073832 [Acipenser sinensis]
MCKPDRSLSIIKGAKYFHFHTTKVQTIVIQSKVSPSIPMFWAKGCEAQGPAHREIISSHRILKTLSKEIIDLFRSSERQMLPSMINLQNSWIDQEIVDSLGTKLRSHFTKGPPLRGSDRRVIHIKRELLPLYDDQSGSSSSLEELLSISATKSLKYHGALSQTVLASSFCAISH